MNALSHLTGEPVKLTEASALLLGDDFRSDSGHWLSAKHQFSLEQNDNVLLPFKEFYI
jgi:plasmid maintenance system antidote protein VapI